MTFSKQFTTFAAIALSTTILTATSALGRDTVIGLSPFQKPADLKAQIESSILHLAETLEPGEIGLFFDAANSRLIGSFEVPEGASYSNVRARIQANRAGLGNLKRFLNSAEAVPGRIGALDLPGFFHLIRSAYPAPDGADMILLGSPIAPMSQASSLTMQGARVPNDGHIAADISASPYGTGGLQGSLEGYDVYFGLTDSVWAVSASHAYHVERAWSLTAEAHGAHMAFFGEDLSTLLRLAGQDAPERVHAAPLVQTDKLEMLVFAPDTGVEPVLYAADPQNAPAPEPIWKAARDVSIGISWNVEGIDLDLYVRPTPSSQVIFYSNADTSEGRLFKDYTSSPDGFETVALNGVVDLSQLQLAVNFYGGRNPGGIAGELRIAIGSQVWAQPFQIPATSGNGGQGAEQALVQMKLPNDAWGLFEPLNVLGVE